MKQLIVSLKITVVFLIIVCGVYPVLVWGISQGVFPKQANGSMVTNDQGKVVGSELLAQGFAKPEYFHPRQSAAGNGYDPTSSGGTNYGPTSDKLIHGAKGFDGIQQLADKYRKENGLAPNALVPVDAVTRSASGLDPEISVVNANLQAQRIATARGITLDQVKQIISDNTEGNQLIILGTQRVNVLKCNLALDHQYPVKKA
jgi:K+-transporting ATPase ATPase C chain